MIHHIINGDNVRGDVIFLHGFGGSTVSFAYAANIISKQAFRTTLVDMYGFGKTPPLDRPMTLDDYVKSIEEIIEYYRMENVILTAHSFGGRVAIRLAASNRRIKKLVLTDSAGIPPRRALKYYFKVYSYKLFKKLGITLNTGSRDYKGLSDVMKKTFVNIVNDDLTPYLDKIDCPALLVWGKNDSETPLYMAEIMKKNISDSALIVFENCGHFCYLEEPYRFIKILSAFCVDGGEAV
ncbi:MAG: alpha/beta hydrolase [Clostridiales bacterium]|jgi:pimeloyl-ACP methyl ester carboxylesterase|nr:alpha/beta hydrolase [Clostridiales bacterium]